MSERRSPSEGRAEQPFWQRIALPYAEDSLYSRVVRTEENFAQRRMREGGLILVRAPRKSGKSTLRQRLVGILAEEIARTPSDAHRTIVVEVGIDFVTFNSGNDGRSPEAFDEHLIGRFAPAALAAGYSAEEVASLVEGRGAPGVWFWERLAHMAVAKSVDVRVFVDELDTFLLDRDLFETWLTALRQVHGTLPPGTLGVCLLSQLPSSLLFRPGPRTPFNSADEIVLPDFTKEEIRKHMMGEFAVVDEGLDVRRQLVDAVWKVTSGQPHLTQAILESITEQCERDADNVANYYQVAIKEFLEKHPECRYGSQTYRDIEQIVAKHGAGVWPHASEAIDAYGELMSQEIPRRVRGKWPRMLFDPYNNGHRLLEAIGLCKVGKGDDGEQYISVRNEVVYQLFDLEWVANRRAELRGKPGIAATGAAASKSPRAIVKAMEDLALERICGSEWGLAHQVTLRPGSAREVIENTLFEFELNQSDPDERLSLQFFVGVSGVASQLWRSQVRTLRRLGGANGSLPAIYKGDVLDDHRIAFIITHRPKYSLSDAGALDHFRANRAEALQQFENLVSGLEVFARETIVHRNISPATIRFDLTNAEGGRALQFTQFEFAVMLRSVLPRFLSDSEPSTLQTHAATERHKASLQDAFLENALALPYAAPEYLQGIFGGPHEPLPVVPTSDVFSLAMIGITWFVGSLSVEEFAGVLKPVNDGSDRLTYDSIRHAEVLTSIQARIDEAVRNHRLPRSFGELLREMISDTPRRRPTAYEVAERIGRHQRAITSWVREGESKPLLAAYSYWYTAERLDSLGLVLNRLGTEESRAEVEDLIKQELKDAALFHASDGFAPYVDVPKEEHRDAVWVLMGQRLTFFCQPYLRLHSGFAKLGEPVPHALRLAYMWTRPRLFSDTPSEAVRINPIAPLEIVEQQSAKLERDYDASYGSWKPILDKARGRIRPLPFEVSLAALQWLVKAQDVQLELTSFRVRRNAQLSHAKEAYYELDEGAYSRWLADDAFRTAVFKSLTWSGPRDFFLDVYRRALDNGDKSIRVSEGKGWISEAIIAVTNAGVCITASHPLLSDTARMELASLRVSRSTLPNQVRAIKALENDEALHSQLLLPHVTVRDAITNRPGLTAALVNLEPGIAGVVRELVGMEPMAVIHGPPGTGKTTVVSAAIDALLRDDPTMRILITAQSHAGVDNIALRLQARLAKHSQFVPAIREASDAVFQSNRIHDDMIGARSKTLASAQAARIRTRCDRHLTDIPDGLLRRAYETLRHAAKEHVFEIQERIEEGANIVYATTAGTNGLHKGAFMNSGPFDMAIVDEASKAWPTEILQSLTLANQYLLVGDHKQLPAFGDVNIEAALSACITAERDAFRYLANHEPAVREWLSLFESFFHGRAKLIGSASRAAVRIDKQESALKELNVQFRMRPSICRVVSEAFYGSKLVSHESTRVRADPEWLRGSLIQSEPFCRRVVWIDTGDDVAYRNIGELQNDEEAILVAHITAYFARLARVDGTDSNERVVAISPYRRQNLVIARHLDKAIQGGASRFVKTTDSFQGQEADVVVMSLVRTLTEDPLGFAPSLRTRYGFLASPQRANVMLSRARELEIIVGDFALFMRAAQFTKEARKDARLGSSLDPSFWSTVCELIATHGIVIRLAELPSELALRDRMKK